MKDNNVVAFYCNNCHETVLNCEHNSEQLHEKGLCAICLKKQNKTKDKWQKLKEWLESEINNCYHEIENYKGTDINHSVPYYRKKYYYEDILGKMQELEGEDE